MGSPGDSKKVGPEGATGGTPKNGYKESRPDFFLIFWLELAVPPDSGIFWPELRLAPSAAKGHFRTLILDFFWAPAAALRWIPSGKRWQKAIEDGHRNSVFTREKWWFSIVTLVYQTVMNLHFMAFGYIWHYLATWLRMYDEKEKATTTIGRTFLSLHLLHSCSSPWIFLPMIVAQSSALPGVVWIPLWQLPVWPTARGLWSLWLPMIPMSSHLAASFSSQSTSIHMISHGWCSVAVCCSMDSELTHIEHCVTTSLLCTLFHYLALSCTARHSKA